MKSAYANAASVKTAARKAAPTAGSKKKWRYVATGLLLALVLAIWCFWPNSQVAKIRQMQEELFSTPREQMSPEERQEKLEALRAEQEKLSPEERKQLRQDMGKQFQKKRNAQAIQYLAMSHPERQKVIDEMVAREQTMQQKRAQAGGGGPGGTGGPGGQGGPGAGGPPGGPGGKGAASTAEDRDNKRREMLLHVPPEARAGMDQMRQDAASRRVQLGLPPTAGKGPGR